MTGRRSDPPMPILITLQIRLPVCPFQALLRTRSVKSAILSRTARTSGTTFLPSFMIEPPRGARSATWSRRAVLRDIDLVALEHGVDVLAQARLLHQLGQQVQCFVDGAVIGIVDIDPGGLGCNPLPALGILGEELPEMGRFIF